MRGSRRVLLQLVVLTIGLLSAVLVRDDVAAQQVPYGRVLLHGGDWAGAAAALGDLNVYSNGSGDEDEPDSYGLAYECVELAQRWAAVRFDEQPIWPVAYAYQMWDAAPHLRIPWQQLPNGGAVAPQFGDLVVFGRTPAIASGHVAVVAATGPDHVDIVEQNWGLSNPAARARLTINGTVMSDRRGMPVLGWLRASPVPDELGGAGAPGGFTLDGYGGIHPWGGAQPVAQVASWPGWDIARGLVVQRGSAGGYLLDGWGVIHPFGAAPPVATTATWPGRDIARGIVLRPDGRSGYVLDAWGGIHPFGGAPAVLGTADWASWDIPRGIALRADGVSGYVLDGSGGLHPFGGAPPLLVTAYWPGLDVARGIALRPDGTGGWVVDRWNAVHTIGVPSLVAPTGELSGEDTARGIVAVGDRGGYTITAWGRLRAFGDAPPVRVSAVFASPVARGVG